MSEKLASQCDACGRTTFDRYLESGWIEWRDSGSVSISINRGPNGTARVRFMSEPSKPLDFCDTGCLLTWLAAIPGPKDGSTSSVGLAPRVENEN